ncbi:MAG: hypothetical protein HDR82_08645 [Bacteroides sp.]|nr:hypothetical protein [Bacteroides sp.]
MNMTNLPYKKSLIVPRCTSLKPTDQADDIVNTILASTTPTPIDINNWPAEFPPTPRSQAYLVHDGANIYVLYLAAPFEIRNEVTEDLGPVSDDNCVEIFLRKPGSPRYWNFEFNFAGYLNASSRVTRPRATRLDAVQRAEVLRYPLDAASLSATHSELEGFTHALLVVIPLSLLDIELHGLPTLLEGNLYSLSEKAPHPYYLTWSPINEVTPGFHRPEHFGYLILQ